MSDDDILLRIDAVMEANRVRFDPLAGDQYGSRDSTDGMRWRPEGSGPPVAHPASPYLTREDITGRRDRVNDAFRAEVRRQGLDEETIRIEAIRLEGIPAPTWHPAPDVTADGEPLTVTMRQARFEPRREIRVLVEGEEVYRGVPEPWPSEMSDGPDDSHIATRPRWWQWRPW